MSVPSGYRKITASDVGKKFGEDLYCNVYFDGDIGNGAVANITLDMVVLSDGKKLTIKTDAEAVSGDIFFPDTEAASAIASFDTSGEATYASSDAVAITAGVTVTSVTLTEEEKGTYVQVMYVKETSFTMDTSLVVLGLNETVTRKMTVAGVSDDDIIYTPDDSSIATVDSEGKVTPLRSGVTIIRAVAEGNADFSAYYILHVYDKAFGEAIPKPIVNDRKKN
jgi:hypothetical protein